MTYDDGLRELSLCSGAGGGLLATQHLLGWRTVCYVEVDAYPLQVLTARIRDGYLNDAPIWDDVRTFDGRPWRGCVDVITAGFPCQPWSVAGRKRGDADDRNLWPDITRIIGEVRPHYVFLENVPGILNHEYFGIILGDLAQAGYDARWAIISAASQGAPHKRERLWIVAHAQKDRGGCQSNQFGGKGIQSDRSRRQGMGNEFSNSSQDVAHTYGGYGPRKKQGILGKSKREKADRFTGSGQDVANSTGEHGERCNTRKGDASLGEASPRGFSGSRTTWWDRDPAEDEAESRLGRVVDGMADRVDRLKALGEGQVPAVVRAAWLHLSREVLGETK